MNSNNGAPKSSIILTILSWFAVAFFLFFSLGAFVTGGILGGILMFAMAILLLPIKPLRNIWHGIIGRKTIALKPILAAVVFVTAIAMTPTNGETPDNNIEVSSSLSAEIKDDDEDGLADNLYTYDISTNPDIVTTNLFENPDIELIKEKLSLVDNINKVLSASGNLYLVHSNLIGDGITDLDVVAEGTQYGGIIEILPSETEAIIRGNEISKQASDENIFVANRLLIRLSNQIDKEISFISIIEGIGKETEIIAETEEIVEVESAASASTNSVVGEAVAYIPQSTTPSNAPLTSGVPAYNGAAYAVINNNIPNFSDAEKSNTSPFEYYSNLDSKGRCGVAFANICKEIMPTEARGSIGMIKPSGWKTVKYNGLIDGNYLYNRCHLIGYQLAGENANTKNLITGTRYLNVDGMLPFENKVANYVESKGNHVLYRVTPIFEGNNLVADGVQIEAWSVEDGGAGICFNVFCYNIQPGIVINYSNGESALDTATPQQTAKAVETATAQVQNQSQSGNKIQSSDSAESGAFQIADNSTSAATGAVAGGVIASTGGENSGATSSVQEEVNEPLVTDAAYILNTNTKKFHYPSCSSASDIKPKNRAESNQSRDEIIEAGYVPCKRCNP